jgi:biopolymer transport protein ExbD
MTLRMIVIGGVSALLGLCLTVASQTSAQTPKQAVAPNADLQLRLSLRLEESGQVTMHLEMPVNETSLRSLLKGEEKRPAVFLAATKNIPYQDVVRAIDMLGSLGLHKISLDVKLEKAGHDPRP